MKNKFHNDNVKTEMSKAGTISVNMTYKLQVQGQPPPH